MLKTSSDFRSAKIEGRRLSMVTCYDYTFARILSNSPVDAILVGDSAAMVVHGYPSTLYADLNMMEQHTAAVVRGAGGRFIVADMPFLSFRKGIDAALDAAHRLMKAGANSVKLEGVNGHADVIERLVESGIPVMGHLGLQPQSIHTSGGYKVQGRTDETAAQITRDASELERLGAFAVVLECVPADLARRVTASLSIPTIGIGAGSDCDGQVLVLQDLLGMNIDFHPKFARPFATGAETIGNALTAFDRAVKNATFPSPEESYR